MSDDSASSPMSSSLAALRSCSSSRPAALSSKSEAARTCPIDWSNELVNSTLWVLEAFVIAALCLAVVLVLLRRFTGWGRQFWRITGEYFAGRASWPVWLLLAALLASAVVSVRVSVLISYYAN